MSIRVGLLIAVSLVTSKICQADLIINGGFEQPAIPADSYRVYGTTTTPGIPGWTVITDDVDINTSNVFGAPFEGLQWLDLNGQSPGAIEQAFATVIGANYDLSFRYANNTASGFDTTGRVDVLGAGSLLSQDFSHQGSTTANMNYSLFSGSFVANSAFTTLRFTSTFYGTSGIALDAVSVLGPEVSAVSEPSTLALVGAFSLCMVGYRMRFGMRSP